MLPTLHVGDFILVNKFSYGVRLPVINTKILDTGSPDRGDVMVFRYPKQPEIDYIKRVIGLPGDKVGYFNKTLYINGEEVKTELVDKPSEMLGTIAPRVQLKHEFLNSDPHEIFLDPQRQSMEGEVTVPEGHYFVMGITAIIVMIAVFGALFRKRTWLVKPFCLDELGLESGRFGLVKGGKLY